MTVTDADVHRAMRDLHARGLGVDASGAASVAALAHLEAGLGTVAVLTEGVTDPERHAAIVRAA